MKRLTFVPHKTETAALVADLAKYMTADDVTELYNWEGKAKATANMPKGWAFYAYTGWSTGSYDGFKKWVDEHMAAIGEKHGVKKYRVVPTSKVGPKWWRRQYKTNKLVLVDHPGNHRKAENKWCVMVWVGRGKNAPKVVQHDRKSMESINESFRMTERLSREVTGMYYGSFGYMNYGLGGGYRYGYKSIFDVDSCLW